MTEALPHTRRRATVRPPPDDERRLLAHVKDRQHDAAAQRIGHPDLGDALGAAAPRPQLRDAPRVRASPQLESERGSHVGVDAVCKLRSWPVPGMKNVLTVRSEPAAASIFRERGAHRSRPDLSLKLGDLFRVPLRFPVHRVLQPLQQLLEVRGARPALRAPGGDRHADRPRRWSVAPAARQGAGSDGSVRSVLRARRSSSLADLVVSSGTGRIAPALLLGHPADHQRAALHLLADEFQLRLALLLGSLTRRPHNARSPEVPDEGDTGAVGMLSS
jgi:hypothetical protein